MARDNGEHAELTDVAAELAEAHTADDSAARASHGELSAPRKLDDLFGGSPGCANSPQLRFGLA
jgi:hypothetical protein